MPLSLSGERNSSKISVSCSLTILINSSILGFSLWRFSSQKFTFSFRWERQVNILSEVLSCRETKNLLPLICRYWENRVSRGSLWRRRPKIKSYPSSKSSFIKNDCDLRVVIRALDVCFERKLSEILDHDSSQFAKLLQNSSFPSPLM